MFFIWYQFFISHPRPLPKNGLGTHRESRLKIMTCSRRFRVNKEEPRQCTPKPFCDKTKRVPSVVELAGHGTCQSAARPSTISPQPRPKESGNCTYETEHIQSQRKRLHTGSFDVLDPPPPPPVFSSREVLKTWTTTKASSR